MKVLIASFWFVLTSAFLLAPANPIDVLGGVAGAVRLAPVPALKLASNAQSVIAPHINSVQLFLDGQLVDQLTIGTKAKRYSLKIAGQGFDPAAKVIIDGMKARVLSAAAIEVDANLRGGPLMFPGEVGLHVVNPDGETSNKAILEVVTDPSVLSIATITPNFGPSGTQVTITGNGFSNKGNHVRLLLRATDVVGVTPELDSSDTRTIVFNLPDFVCPPCTLSVPPCEAPCYALNPGDYEIFVINDKGMSNGVDLLVSSPDGPIGFWGEQGLSVEVTDTNVTISGACFVGQIPETLVTDAMGNFNIAGTFTPMIGPVGQGRRATYQGTITGKTMTFSITETLPGSSSTIGPFTVTFGKQVFVVHPCA
jgi:hypothetical protein